MNGTAYWQLCVNDEFAAAHALRHYQGKCERLHGHNFSVEVCVQGRQLTADTEMLIDFTLLKQALKEVLRGLDHCVLNETPPFDGINPSSENLARHIFRAMAGHLALLPEARQAGVRMVHVRVGESPRQSALYAEPQAPASGSVVC